MSWCAGEERLDLPLWGIAWGGQASIGPRGPGPGCVRAGGAVSRAPAWCREGLCVAYPPPALTTPLLVIHDRGDAEIPWQDGRVIAQAWRGAETLMTDGLGHRRVLRDPDVVAAAVAFVAALTAERGVAAPGEDPQTTPLEILMAE